MKLFYRNQSHSSVWLTAYCARVFQEASFYEWENYIYIDPTVIAKSVEWVLDHQDRDGAFFETTWSPNRKYNASVNWPNDEIKQRNVALTAHVLIMLESVKDLTSKFLLELIISFPTLESSGVDSIASNERKFVLHLIWCASHIFKRKCNRWR